MPKFSKEYLEKVFHAYDIRGEVPDQLNKEFFEELGRAFAKYLNASKIAVGRDFRPDSRDFQQSFIEGIVSEGCDVVDVGEIGTEMIYFVCGENPDFDGGATITASHNPAGWNGCKMVGKKARAISGSSGLSEIMELMLDGGSDDKGNKQAKSSSNLTPGKVEAVDIYPEFKNKILSFLEGVEIHPMKIVVDAGNGIGGNLFDYVFGDLPLDVVKMYFEPDGNFPNHEANPSKEENVEDIKKRVLEENADLGIAIDGDADRVFFIDKKGRNPSGIYSGTILARYFFNNSDSRLDDKSSEFRDKLSTHAEDVVGGDVVVGGDKTPVKQVIIQDPRVKWVVEKEVEKLGGTTVMCRVGHSYFKEKMKEFDAVFGIEMSSHFYYRDFYYADSGMTTIAVMLRLLSEGLDFSGALDSLYASYPNSGEVNFRVEDPVSVFDRVEAAFRDCSISRVDGLSVVSDSWRFNLRSSNTQPLIRLNVEGVSVDVIAEVYHDVVRLIGGERTNRPGLDVLVGDNRE